MKVGSVCSGIEAATVAWAPLGWRFAWYSEIEPFCCALLKHYYRETQNLGDMTAITEGDLERHEPIDLLVGGTPCQSFSVAGLRKGMADPRGNLALRFLQLARATRARWVVWENVPGVLSSGEGRDFGTFLGALAELGYGWAYRILDAQYFGVPQRRRRVFVVGHLGDWRRAVAVLFERESLRRNPPPSRETKPDVAGTIDAGSGERRGAGINPGLNPEVARPLAHGSTLDHYDESQQTYVTGPLQSHSKEHGHAMTTQQAAESGQVVAFHARQDPISLEQSLPLEAKGGQAVAIPIDMRNAGRDPEKHDKQNRQGVGVGQDGDPSPTVDSSHVDAVASGMAVRRLLPIECEALQGFPRNYTLIPYRNKPACDGPRYRALGNSMAVPVMRWIGERIIQVEKDLT